MNPGAVHCLKVLLADDDADERFAFEDAAKELPIPIELITLDNGEKLMKYLLENRDNLPDILFLDIYMPRKNGLECLAEIKSHQDLYDLPVIIFSGELTEEIVDQLYRQEAHYYIRKPDLSELKQFLRHTLLLLASKKVQSGEVRSFSLN